MNSLFLKLSLLCMGISISVLAQEVSTPVGSNNNQQNSLGSFDHEAVYGLTSVRGENDSDSMHGGYELLHEYGNFKNLFDSDLYYTAENHDATTHIFMVEAKSRYYLKKDDYVYAGIYYEDDRFSGYSWENYYSAGYGHVFHISQDMTVLAEAGIGQRRTRLRRGNRDRDFIGIAHTEFNWQLDDGVQIRQKITALTGSDGTDTKSDTSIKAQVYENIALKLTHFIKHQTDAPVGISHTKTITSINLVYNF